MEDEEVKAMDEAAEAFALKEAELMGWSEAQGRQRVGLWREELDVAVVVFLRAIAKDDETLHTMGRRMEVIAKFESYEEKAREGLRALADLVREQSEDET